MAEGKAEKKKPATVKRVLRWIAVGLLSLLLVAGLVFQAPWKVTVLLLVILLACTALPKPLRKWFWLSVGVIIIALIIWVFLPDRNGDWRPYTFDEEIAALEAKYAIPDEENAAVVYKQVFATSDIEPNAPDFFVRTDPASTSGPWLSAEHPETAEWLRQHASTIAKLMQACQKEKCAFPVNLDPGPFNDHMKLLAAMRLWAQLLVSAANNDLAEGRADAGLEKCLCMIQMASYLCQQPTEIDVLVGLAIEALAIKQIKRFIATGDATAEHLRIIEESLAKIKHDWSSDFPKILEYEKLSSKNWVGSMIYQINPKGEVRLSRDPMATMRSRFPQEVPPQTYWQRKLTKAGVTLGWFLMPSTPQKAAKIIDASFETFYPMAEPDFDWQKEPRELSITSLFSPRVRFNYRYMVKLLADMSEKGYYRLHDIFLRVTAEQRGSLLLIALRRYKNKNGNWPKSLDDIKDITAPENLIDPINDGSFVYKLTDDNFTLYSKGKNNIDEHGKYDSSWPREGVKRDDWLIWPPRSRKIKKEGANAG